jgi:hypothetical protein
MDKHKAILEHVGRPNRNGACIQELIHTQQTGRISYQRWYVEKGRADMRACKEVQTTNIRVSSASYR